MSHFEQAPSVIAKPRGIRSRPTQVARGIEGKERGADSCGELGINSHMNCLVLHTMPYMGSNR
jgi:hypothetical protein